jgi:predicted ATPase
VQTHPHAGEIGWSDDDVVGFAIHEAARIMDAAHGGQILVSGVLRDLTAGSAPPGVTLRSLGPHRLKDIDAPVELLQVTHADLPAEFPPLRTRDIVVDLPVPRTSFIGREREVAKVLALLGSSRHVTLTGVGGSGKTRLALEVATRDAERYPDGVFFVDLAPLADPDQVVGAVAASVDVQGEPDDLEAMLTNYLSSRCVLIVLDNCEHIVDACADVIDLLFERCHAVHVLATSREALQTDGEQTFSVRSLDIGDETSDAVTLFLSRARGVKADFELTDANRSDVLAICERLDGIPLAIELAAGRVDHMSPAEIAKRLDDRFELLIGGRRRRAQRQQTLQAAMDWSWELLTDEQKTLLRRLAVFAGPFTLDAAEAVSGVRPGLEPLRSLVAKSLVDIEQGDQTRYRLLETVRLYAQEQLVACGEAEERRDAHRDWYLARAEDVPFDRYNDLVMIRQAIANHANLRAAMDWSADRDEPELLARLVLATGLMWTSSPGLFDEGGRWLLTTANDERLPARVRADAFAMLGTAAVIRGDIPAVRPFAEKSVALDPTERPAYAHALWVLGRYDEAIDLAGRLGLGSMHRFVRAWEASLRLGPDPEGAVVVLEQVMAELPPNGFAWDFAFAFVGAILARLALDDPDRALQHIATFRSAEIPDVEQWFGSLGRFDEVVEAMVLAQLGRFDEARSVLTDISRAALRDRYPLLSHDCLAAFAYIAYREGDLVRAAELLRPVSMDGRIRFAPMGSFVGRFLAMLRQELSDTGVEPALPRVREYVRHMQAVFAAQEPPNPDTPAIIEKKLLELTS